MTFENKMTRNLLLQTRDLDSSISNYMVKYKYKMVLESRRQVIFKMLFPGENPVRPPVGKFDVH